MISRQWYCITETDGHEHDVRWLRVGLQRYYAEVGKWGMAARFGSAVVVFSVDRAEEDE